MEDIIIAIVGGVCVAVPSIIATITSNKKSTSLMTYRLDQLEKKQDKHNSIIERTFKLEQEVKDLKKELGK